jgi:hypothetical protein
MSTEIKNEQIEQLTQQFKEMEVADLFKALKAGLTVAQSKASSKAKAKAGSMPKGACPPQLKLNNAWVKHVKDYVNQNGWEAFSVPTTMTDKETGAKTLVVEELPASILHDGAHIFEGSVTEKTPQGVQVSHKHAMTLSKQWKEEKTHRYEEFVAAFNPEEAESDVESVASTESVTVVRTTMAEKIAAKAVKEAEAKAAKEAKEAEKAAAKAAKEAEKEAKERAAAELKAQKALEAEAAKAERVRAAAEAEAAKAVKIPKAAIVKAEKAEKVEVKAAPAKKTVIKAVVKPVVKAWSCADDGNAHAWEHEGKLYARNFTNDVWNREANGDVTTWAGVYLPAENRIDETAEEPIYADE